MISDCTLTREQLDTCRRYFGNPEMTEAQALRRFETKPREGPEFWNPPNQCGLGKSAQDSIDALIEKIGKLKAGIRAKVEHPFRVVKR